MRKWKCIKSNDRDYWTVGKIYTTDDNGKGLISDNDEYGLCNWIEPWKMNGCWRLGAQFEEVNSFTQSDLKPCMLVKLRGYDEWCIIIQTKDGLHINSLKNFECASSIDEYIDFRYEGDDEIFRQYDIIEVKDLSDSYICQFTYKEVESETLWKLEEKSLQQIKLEELELKQREIADEMSKLRKEMN